MIESAQNEKIKYISRLLTDNRFRKKSNAFVVEGTQENERALAFGFENLEYFLCEEIYNKPLPQGKVHFVSKKIYEKIAYRENTEGIIGIYEIKTTNLSEYHPSEHASIIIVESVEKPGNLGAILRSCEAFGVEALIVTDPKVDFYNPNVIRSSVGCFFGMNTFAESNEKTLEFLKKHEFSVFTTFMDEKPMKVFEIDLNKKAALCFGTEHSGLSPFWKHVGRNMQIPMCGTIDSLNLSNAVAISCYEILRQKSVK